MRCSPNDNASAYLRKHPGRAIFFSSAGVVTSVSALTLLATTGHGLLPTIIQGGNYALMISTG